MKCLSSAIWSSVVIGRRFFAFNAAIGSRYASGSRTMKPDLCWSLGFGFGVFATVFP